MRTVRTDRAETAGVPAADAAKVNSPGLSEMSAMRRRRSTVLATLATLVAAVALLTPARPAPAQENLTPEQLKKAYEDAKESLKGAQNRVNQLNDDNKKLEGTVEDLKKQLAAVTKERDELKQQQEEQADKTFFLRSHYAAWEAFIRQYPDLKARWKLYMESDFVSPRRDMPKFMDEDWPTSADS